MRYVDPVALAEARAEIQRMKDEGILTPDPTRPKIDISSYLPPDDFDLTPYAKEEAAAFLAEVNLRIERQKQWPEIEERPAQEARPDLPVPLRRRRSTKPMTTPPVIPMKIEGRPTPSFPRKRESTGMRGWFTLFIPLMWPDKAMVIPVPRYGAGIQG